MFRIVSAIYLWQTTAPDVVQEDIHCIIQHIITVDRTFYRGIFKYHDDLVTVYNCIFPVLLGILIIETPNNDNMVDHKSNGTAVASLPSKKSTGQQTDNRYFNRTSRTSNVTQGTTLETNQHVPLKLPLQIIQKVTSIFHEVFVEPSEQYKKETEEKLLLLKVSKYINASMASKATDNAAIIANEPTLEAKHLQVQDLNDQRVNEQSNVLEK
jgi:hypothetical protein